MTVVFSFAALGLFTAILALYLKETGFPTGALLVTICGGVILLMRLLPYFTELFDMITEIATASGLHTDYLGLVLKVVGIAYVGEFAASVCRDAGESSIAKKMELGTKVIIMVMAMPLLEQILSTVLEVFH